MDLLGWIVIITGVAFLFLGCLGIIRLPDVYNRVQAGTKCTTMGACFTIIGVGIMQPGWFWKTLIIAVFILISNPVSSHALGRAAYKSGIPLWGKSKTNQAAEFEQKQKKR
ncbi:MAG TPA: monovalent cation/H(+) antiporter subunit G [Spirochaetota bacterium]|nr:monovalent cation/H(+) antiporter subunit G [Spirochaetota bacterium]